MSTPESTHTPLRTLLTLLLVGAGCGILALVIPEDGIALSDEQTLDFVSYAELFEDKETGIEDAKAFLEGYDDILQEDSVAQASGKVAAVDSTAIKQRQDSLKAAEVARRRAMLKIQKGEGGIDNMEQFYAALQTASDSGEKVRVLHYGDSQIEGDRITGYLRNELQKRFGGTGPGLVPPVEVVPSLAIDQSFEGNWERFTVYGKRDTTLTHDRFGAMGTFARCDSAGGSLVFKPSRMTYKFSKQFNRATLFVGHFTDSLQVQCFVNDSLISTRSLADSSGLHAFNYRFGSTPGEVRFAFNGQVECYGVSFEGGSGIQVDNVPMRGSSGTIFRRIDRSVLRQQYRTLEPNLVLLQYGGNTVPYIDDTTKAVNYGRWMQSQIRLLKDLMPDAAFILIGPSDMAYKEKDAFVTYPYLEVVRNELKKAAYETRCGFWDIYEVMGGRNSMQAWVEADPPLAGSDYVHFTPKGARKVAELFTKALLDEAKEDAAK